MQIPLWLINNWRLLAIAIPSALLLLQVWSWRSEALKVSGLEKDLSKCYSDQKLTQEISIDYQKKISSIELRLTNAKRLRPEVCVPISNSTSSVIRTDTAKLSGQNGVSSWALIEYAADAQKVNERASLCKDFLEKFSQ